MIPALFFKYQESMEIGTPPLYYSNDATVYQQPWNCVFLFATRHQA